ncbi:NAD(P)-binding protein, partial [Exidia glandulosa HHB12029]
KIITVFGATGAAGGSVARYLLEDATFAVRAVTRNASGAPAEALREKGAEVVEADLDKPETIPATLVGAYGVSALTDFWTLFPKTGDASKTQAAEYSHGVSIVDAAKAAGVQHFVWFTLPHSDTPVFEGKYKVEQYLKASGVPFTTFTNCLYYENLVNPGLGFLKPLQDGTLSLELPVPENVYLPFYTVSQTGAWILQAFKDPAKYLGQDIVAVGEHLTPTRIAEILGSTLGKRVNAKHLSFEDFQAFGQSQNPVTVLMYLSYKCVDSEILGLRRADD